MNDFFTLRFVYGHSKARAEWELKALELEWEVGRDHRYSWNEDILACRWTLREYGCLNDVGHQFLHHQLGTIAKLWCIQIPKEHYWGTNLEDHVVRGSTRGFQGM